jgi:hypothetical protein
MKGRMPMGEKESSRTAMERHCLVIRDEQEFCIYIESRLREEGFELVETSPIACWSPLMSAGAF